MRCPECGKKALCVDTRENGAVTRRRRYQCVECPTRFGTLEEIVSVGDGRGKNSEGRFQSYLTKHQRLMLSQVKAQIRARLLAALDTDA